MFFYLQKKGVNPFMNIFKLLGTIAINNEEANDALEQTGENAEKSHSRISGAFSKIGSAAVAVGKAMAVGLAAGTAAVAGLAKNAMDSYADYEQLVGGVDTLFKESSEIIKNYANEAYKTAGLSANQYMETVTSFSASLIQSMEGDTQAAAEKANRAIVDMSDNANKMGTDMTSIQNAYQGFAKQNYTMLDNLKLGYGGTKEEMARLIQDAAKMTDVQNELGVSIDANSMSYGNIIDAISVVQKSMGIMGATSAEAGSTISGSLASVKAAWTNLVTGLGNENADLSGLMDELVNGIVAAASNVVPRLEAILSGMGKALTKIVPVLTKTLPSMLKSVLPSLLQAASTLLQGLITAIVTGLPDLLSVFLDTLLTLTDSLLAMLPDFLSGLETVFHQLVAALPQLIEMLASSLPTLIPMLVNSLVSMILVLMEYLPAIIQPLVDNLPIVIVALVDALMLNLPVLVAGIIQLFIAISKMLPQLSKSLFDEIPRLLYLILEALWAAIPILLDGIAQYWAEMFVVIEGLVTPIISFFSDTFSAAWEGIKAVFAPVGDFFSGIWDGIKSAFGAVTSWFEEVFSNAWQKVKDVFSTGSKIFDGIKEGISSVFTTTVNAIIRGINKVISIPFDNINNLLNGIRDIEIAGISPFSDLWDENPLAVPQIPELAKGGVLKKGQVGLLEGNGAEAVVPLENNHGWISKVASDMKNELNGNISGNAMDAIMQKMDMMLDYMQKMFGMQVVLDSGALVGELTPGIDEALGMISDRKGRGN